MAQLDIYPAASAIDFQRDVSHLSLPSDQNDVEALLNALVSISPPAQRFMPGNTSVHHETPMMHAAGPDVFIPNLPPLHRGHPDVHVHENIIRAFANDEADSEKAFFVADLSQVYGQYERFKRCLPDIEPFFAVKSNPDPYVLRLLAALGGGFDCASNGEISQVLKLGIDPSRIIFANPCKPASFVRAAAKSGVDMMTFDNADELYKVSRAHPRAKLVVRILTDDSKSLCRLGLKFGAPLDSVPGLLAKAKELGLDVIGVSFHVGSGCFDPNAFGDAVMRARAVFDMGKAAGYTFNLLDVGGGFEDANFEKMAKVLSDSIDVYFPNRHEEGVRVIAEPGRFFVSRAFTLAANIIARRARQTEEDVPDVSEAVTDGENPSVMYYINDGVYGSFNCILFDHQVVHPYVVTLNRSFVSQTALGRETLQSSSVWGPTCDSIDLVCPATQLPSSLQVGDWLGFRNMGAYTTCAASQFNGFETSSVVYTSGVDSMPEASAVRRALAAFTAG